MKLTKTLYCYLDDEELKELDTDASSLRLTRSEYVRKQIRESKMIPTPKMNYTEFTLILKLILDRVESVADRLWHKVVFDVQMLREALRDIEELITISEVRFLFSLLITVKLNCRKRFLILLPRLWFLKSKSFTKAISVRNILING